MKLGEGGEAFFVFKTTENIPAALQTSPPVSPEISPKPQPTEAIPSIDLPEPEPLDLATEGTRTRGNIVNGSVFPSDLRASSDLGDATPRLHSPLATPVRPVSGDWSGHPKLPIEFVRSHTDEILPSTKEAREHRFHSQPPEDHISVDENNSRSHSPPPVSNSEAVTRAINLSKKLWSSNIPSQVTETGDLMLDMTGYKSTEEEALKAELIARKILTEELEGNYDIGSLIGEDENGNLWIYSSVEAKEAADRRSTQASLLQSLNTTAMRSADAVSDPGYHSDDAGSESTEVGQKEPAHLRHDSDSAVGLLTVPGSPQPVDSAGDPNLNYAKTLRLTSEQLMGLDLRPGANTISFTVNKATCSACIYFWKHDVHIVISDIDGTITKSDAMGHLMNMVGRDWTHAGVAKLYTDVAQNGYNVLYLTSRSVGQADTTRNYLWGIIQDGYKLPKGPVILSPDRTMAALKREVYLRRPEVFKMACLRDIMNLFNPITETSPSVDGSTQYQQRSTRTPFYAGFGNRLNDALSYRSVSIPPTRIFTINSNAEVSMHLLSLNKYRTSYVTMREIVDHYFPPVGMLIKEGGEEYTDFNYWRDQPLDVDDFSASESEDSEVEDYDLRDRPSVDESFMGIQDEDGDLPANMEDSYYSRDSIDSIAMDAEDAGMEDSITESVDGNHGKIEPTDVQEPKIILEATTDDAKPEVLRAVEKELAQSFGDVHLKASTVTKTPTANSKNELEEVDPALD
jgi:phosphatidate phosphatase LPIN